MMEFLEKQPLGIIIYFSIYIFIYKGLQSSVQYNINYKMKQFNNLYDFSYEIKSSISNVEPMQFFKIFGYDKFTFQKAKSPNLSDWSGFYTQFTAEHSMRYLTKKWDDGAQQACLIKLFPQKNSQLKLLKIEHEVLGDPKISGQIKAYCIKKHLKQKYKQFQDLQAQNLLQYLGDKHMLMVCVDAEDNEIIIPHDLLIQQNFTFEHLVFFMKSKDNLLRTVGYKFKDDQQWRKVPSDAQYEPYLLLKQKIFMNKW